MASSGNIKQITLPNGNTYDINAVTVNGHTVETDVPSGALFTDTKYTAASANPKMDGTVAVGTSTKYAREDHVHPSDTSRVPTSRKVNNKALSSDISLTASDVGAIATSAKGAASGVAELDSNGKVPSSQLPSFVDDVLEYNGTSSFPTAGEAGKIYVDTSTNKTYRWGGSSYTEISASLALGETSSTAYRGDRGKTAYTHATDSSRLTTATSSGLYKVASTAEGHIASLTAVTKADITGLGIPGSDTNTKYGLSISGHTVSLVEGGTTASVTVPDNNDNNAVTQTATTTNADYEVLFSSTADNTTRTEGARKNSNMKFNPSTGNLQVTQINGVTVGSSPKFTDNNTTYGLSISDHTVSIVAGGTTSSVTVPDNNTTYTAGTGLSLSGTKFNHSNSVTAATVGTSSATSGQTIAVPYVTYDAQGHITATGTHTHTSSVPPSGVVRGNDSTVGGLDPVTAAYIPTAASNKSFGLPAAAITIEYSTNNGSTWTSYGATDAEKRNLFNESRATSFYLGKATAKANNTVNNRLRVTIEPTDRYCSFHGIYVWFSTNGNTTVMDLERSTIGAKDTFTTVFTGQALSGWSGNNIRYFSYGTFGGGSTQTGNTYKYRVTFRQTAVNTNYPSSVVMDIRFLGDNLWTSPTDAYAKNMLNYRTPYSTDASGNVILPQGITVSGSGANGFTYSGIEAGTGNADRCVWFADSAAVGRPVYDNDFKYNPSGNNLTVGKINGFTIGASVPSGAKFTDTTYTANTTSIGSASGWSAGSAPSLSYTSRSIPNVTSVGSKPSLSYTSRSIPNVTGVGSVPSLSYTARSVGSASGWSAGTAASASVANGVLTITNGTAPSLTVTSVACDDITAWDAGSTPTLGTAISADDITAWDAGSTPTLGTAISADDITAWSAGSVPSLTVTSTTVATGITAS